MGSFQNLIAALVAPHILELSPRLAASAVVACAEHKQPLSKDVMEGYVLMLVSIPEYNIGLLSIPHALQVWF